MTDPQSARPLAADGEIVVSFRAPRAEGHALTLAMKRIALDNDEPVKDTYLRALTDFIARESRDPTVSRALRSIAEQRGETLPDTVTRALTEYVEREAPQ